VKPSWEDESLDRLLRDALKDQPEPPLIEGLALRAVQRAQERSALTSLPPDAGGGLRAGWHTIIALCAASLIVGLAWFASSHLTLLGDYQVVGGTAHGVNGSAPQTAIGLLEVLDSEDAMLAAMAFALVAAVGVAIARAFSVDETLQLGGTSGAPF